MTITRRVHVGEEKSLMWLETIVSPNNPGVTRHPACMAVSHPSEPLHDT